MSSEIVRLFLLSLAGASVSCIYWALIGIFTEKKWIKIIIVALMMTISI